MGQPLGRGTALRVDEQRIPDRLQHVLGQVGTQPCERIGALLDPPRGLDHVAAPERMLAGQRLPEEHADPPHVGGGRGRQPLQALGRDVGERAGDVAERGQRVELGHLGEAEVEQPHVDLVRLRVEVLGEEDVRRLDVAVDDPLAVGVRERLRDLRGDLDRRRVVELAARIASRSVRPGTYS